MKLQLTDGYVINPYIIWGELDYRGYAAIGLQPENDFKDLSFLKGIKSRCQYLRSNNMDFLFISCPLSDFSPDTSVFNLNDCELNQFYKRTYESAQEEMFRTFFRIKSLSGQEVSSLNDQDLSFLWAKHFNPLLNPMDIDHFNASKTILANCLPECNIKESLTGFELNGCLHHFIQIKSYNTLTEIAEHLKPYSFSITSHENGCEILIHLTSQTDSEINGQAREIKSLLHKLENTDYYEVNSSRENLSFFERSIPGWCFGINNFAATEVLTA